VTRLQDDALQQRLAHLAEGTGLTLEGVYRLDLSAETRKANAALAGLGRNAARAARRHPAEQLHAGEIEVVFAHEIGHHVHRHITSAAPRVL